MLYTGEMGTGVEETCKNGGIAIYIRNNINVIDVHRSEEFELIAITASLHKGKHMLICGVYHPPRHSYQEEDLMDYLIDLADTFLENFPDGVWCGGDLNQMDISRLQSLFGWFSLQSQSTEFDKDRLKLMNERISKTFMDNRVNANSSRYDIGSRGWWRRTNNICNYKSTSRCTLSGKALMDLNDMFGQLRTDEDYFQPDPTPAHSS